ncbi:DUF4625 domain-containing protein [Autumnicola musiva]|uniref:DUF4625 domain-containing protein n=1 Tax=Autumnicola musiva TaxID=3075589 RepID=A0ABU3D6M2_9FLAO|nr:DUF4625 domain-containing protein [Zunongwangia sp. F117]MDT0677168.1 DUF4625 domain-containing protein [Zunongwangia sp. F117]
MKKQIIFSLSLFLAISLFSCSSDDDAMLDNEKPQITVNEPTEGESFEAGGELHFDVDFSDNDALSSYKVDIHNNFDGHTHSGLLSTSPGVVSKQASELSPWSMSQTFEIEGNPRTYNAHEHIEIPADIAEGPYHLGITVIDVEGNQNQVYVEFIVGEDHTGEDHGLTITNIESSDVNRGSDLHVGAQLTAEHGIASVSVSIHGHDLEPAEGETAWTFEEVFDSYSGSTAELHEHIDVPANAALGEYHMSITVVDTEGNTHAEGVHFHVTEEGTESSIAISDFHIDEEVTAGEELHIEAGIASEHGVEEIHLHIHSEEDEENGWSYEDTFAYSDETEIDFNEHIDISADAAAGEYHLSLEVIDHDGNTHSESAHFNVVE